MNSIAHVTERDFEQEVLRSDVPVLVDFYADWCGPCRMMAPVLERLSQSFAGRAKIVKVDIESEGGLARRFDVQAIPTLILFSGRKPVDVIIGAVPPRTLESKLARFVRGAQNGAPNMPQSA